MEGGMKREVFDGQIVKSSLLWLVSPNDPTLALRVRLLCGF